MIKYSLVILFIGAALLSSVAFAGESLLLSTQTATSPVVAPSLGTSWRVQGSLHDWPSVNASAVVDRWDSLLVVYVLGTGPNSINFQIYNQFDNANVCGGNLSGLPYPFITYRFQHDAVNKVDLCQAWDMNGNLVLNVSNNFTTDTQGGNNGLLFSGFGTTGSVGHAYFAAYNGVVASNSRPPVTADTTAGCIVYLKWDRGNNSGTLNDLCAAGPYNASMSNGSPTYVATPGQNLVYASALSCLAANCPAWSAGLPGFGVSFRAGNTGQLDCTQSYSQIDASPNVNCFWQSIGGPSNPIWSSQSSQTPTITGLIFGDYPIQLTVSDAAGNMVVSTTHVGAVATDSNGVVVNANPDVDFLFGPMIAFGQNPWGYQDYWALHASQLREADYLSEGWAPIPQWEQTGQGTVSYYFNGVGNLGYLNATLGTTLNGACSATSTSCAVANAGQLDTTSLPTHVVLFDGTNFDEMRVCSISGNTLNWCYDPNFQPRNSYASGVNVLQGKVTGSGTKFLTDPTAPVCPVGAPGPTGPSLYSAGTVTLTAGSVILTGSGTNWTTAMVGDYIRVPSTHGGTAFVFVAQISAFTSATSLTLARAYPSDADTTAGLGYNIMVAQRTPVLRYPHAVDTTGTGELMWGTPGGCESETDFYVNPIAGVVNGASGNTFGYSHDIPIVGGGTLDGMHITGAVYGVTDTSGWVNQTSTGGISFYGESLAHRALYYRSGLTTALTAANYISDWWIKSPWGNGDQGGSTLFYGGEAIGAFVSAILTGRVAWSDLRSYAQQGVRMVNGFASTGPGCAYDDTRDSGYAYAWLILAAIYDPDTTSTAAPGGIPWRSYWQSYLAQMQTNDTNCKRNDNSWSNGFLFNTGLPVLTMTNGSAIATGTGLPPTMCNGIASGTATATNGSNTLTAVSGTFPQGTAPMIFLTGTSGGGAQVFVQSLPYSGTGSTATMGGFWNGDSGTISWVAGNWDAYDNSGLDMMTIAINNDDLTDLQKNWACTWNSPTQITLNRPWDGQSTDASHIYHPFVYILAGYGQQPFMLGIKSLGMNWLSKQTVPTLSGFVVPYTNFAQEATSWIWNNGMDQQQFGTNYGRVFQQCEPGNTNPAGTTFLVRAPFCTYGANPGVLYLESEQNSETGAAHTIYYANNSTTANRTLGDEFYGSLWGYCPWTTGGAYCSTASTASNASQSQLTDGSIHAGKWLGFFTGMGMSHRWPAARLGGVQSAIQRRVSITYSQNGVPAAASVYIRVTAPSGAQTNFACAASPCPITVDDRQGGHLYQIVYLSSTGTVLSQSQPVALPLN